MNAIEVKNLCKIYNQNKPNEFCALKNINLSVKSGELVKNTGGFSMLVAQGTQASRLFRKDVSTPVERKARS